ncbi:uncharacterized protein Z520_04708 [Fonsecaea multimorphosa CBS 102226]|uniref:SWIM-type domain-containing protein n=1 Tax=Fonsecaea multimorphosa CBS 102226 TaxID=1442371 RepID=A0A0D2K007_9EURO|nr:uncharacterized protein Z520_04708 [Fonsecaea multimorphosa CBS 102226]KIX99132.1 hypothetical protein Z520_04708 [Fonsecaea multimorphosa CBS 102226]
MTGTRSQTSVLNSIFRALSQFSDLSVSHPDKHQSSPPQDHPHHRHNGVQRLSVSTRERARPVFLTLHMLFPHELLPALDLLDRGLVTKLVVKHSISGADDQEAVLKLRTSFPGEDHSVLEYSEVDTRVRQDNNGWELFYVQSSSAMDKQISKPRFHPRGGNTSVAIPLYEVHLDSWNCTCAAFSVNMFQCSSLQHSQCSAEFENDVNVSPTGNSRGKIKDESEFGGTATIKFARVPSCKHLVAAFLAKSAPTLFTDSVKESTISREEAVAWGGGWGEHRGS